MANTLTGLYGSGWKFPVTFNEQGPETVADKENIEQSLEILLRTQPGERIMRPDYGCDLQPAVFQNINAALLAQLRTEIVQAVLRHEPRVTLDDLVITQLEQLPSTLQVQLVYHLPGTDAVETVDVRLDWGDALGSKQ
ncbi:MULTISPECIES: GPW/gp25 family protein [Burkholderiaceae]|uniref:GPW/gp25 family protein n=1 Tax=Burkholderiaceae TaxID=119060 RepID=UPI00095BCAC4|nr:MULTISPECIES: GPW/gp25 family protein [Burkholderiaceae]MCG1040900.1 GPW/gp25 family protein [Mycetohabitans sp. B7]SIT64870.1 hypothetical protein SAMN04487769_0073 [Burkholderia sp. b14]